MMPFDTAVLIGAGVVVAAAIAVRVGTRVGLPSLLLFLGLGMVLGDSVMGIEFSDAQVAHDWGLLALAVILAEGGLTTNWADVRKSVGPAALLAIAGTAISIAVVAVFAYLVLGFDFWLAILLGAVLSPTDAAAVFSVLRTVKVPSKLRGLLEAESGLNDAPTILLVAAASTAALAAQQSGGGHVEAITLAAEIGVELLGGAVLGILAGWLGVVVLRRIALPVSGLHPIVVFTWVMVVYGGAATVHVSGFAAAYVCGVIIGNADLPHRTATRSFVESVAWLAQIGLFVMLGLLATPARIGLGTVVVALVVGLVLTFVARPLSVWLCLTPFGAKWRTKSFVSWAGLRGAVPIVLTTIPLATGVPGSDLLFDLVLVFVVAFTVLQAPTLPWLARRLGLVEAGRADDVEIEVAALERAGAELLQVAVRDGSGLAGLIVNELRLPPQVAVSLVIRDDAPFAPESHERLKVGDDLLVVSPTANREETVRRLRALARGGRLARWRGVSDREE